MSLVAKCKKFWYNNNMSTIQYGFVFPGQGVQAVGMGQDLAKSVPVARAVFEEVDTALGYPLSKLMFAGDITELTQTQHAQPAIMAVSMAIVRIIESEVAPVMQLAGAVAGHSLGEYTALCAAGVLNLTDTAKLLKLRGELMTEAAREQPGGMLALLGANISQAMDLAKRSGCYVANDNCDGQVVLSGSHVALTTAKMLAETMHIKRSVPLAVAGPFHSPMMAGAAQKMFDVLNKIQFSLPQIPIFFNATGLLENKTIAFADLLKRQMTDTVHWRETIQNMVHVDAFVECGQGTVLTGLIHRIRPDMTVLNGCDVSGVQSLISSLKM